MSVSVISLVAVTAGCPASQAFDFFWKIVGISLIVRSDLSLQTRDVLVEVSDMSGGELSLSMALLGP